MSEYIVQLREQRITYGPFADESVAKWFAAFLTVEVDPAEVHKLHSPLLETLAWRDTVLAELGSSDRRYVPQVPDVSELAKDVPF